MFKQRRWEQIQNLRLKKTGKQKNCIRQKNEWSNCNSKTVQNNELTKKLLPAPTDYQLTLHALPLSNPAYQWGHHPYGCFQIFGSLSIFFSLWMWLHCSVSFSNGLVSQECWCAVPLLCDTLTFAAGIPRALLAGFITSDFVSSFPRVQPLLMEVCWDPGGLTSLHPSGL